MIPLDCVRQLDKAYTRTIPEHYQDQNGHMTVQYYVHLFADGIWWFLEQVGMDEATLNTQQLGNFALEQHLRYFAEINIGDEVSVYIRLIGLSAKRTHFMGFIVNETAEQLAATVEAVSMNIDMTQRQGTPFRPEHKQQLDAIFAKHSALSWDAPICGVMSA